MIIASIILDREREKAASNAVSKERKRINAQTKAYYERMRAALDAGEDFTEPPPYFGKDAE